MNKQYYKPSLEDIVLGLEYEYLHFDYFKNKGMYDKVKTVWYKDTLESFDFTTHKRPPTPQNIKLGYIRCKLY
jgi:hypothetical protein